MGTNSRQRMTNKSLLHKMYPDERCFDCGKIPEEVGQLEHEIHHKNGDDTDQNPMNLLWACHGCNHKKEYRKDALLGNTDLRPEHKIAVEVKPVFYNWLWHKIQENNFHYPLIDAINSGAYNFSVDITTIKRWLQPVAYSMDGPYKIMPHGRMGAPHICMKGKVFDLELDKM